MEAQLMQVKDVMFEGLAQIAKRGEELGALQQKSEQLKTAAVSFKKKSKKLNQSWWQRMFGNGCSGPCGGTNDNYTRGAVIEATKMQIKRKANID